MWDDTEGTILANTTVRSDGTFSASFNIPSNATAGAHSIYFLDRGEGTLYVMAASTFTVSATGQLPSQIENPDPRLISQPIFYRLGGLPSGAYDELNPPPNAEHLVVIIHGWEPEGVEYDLMDENSVENKMKSAIEKIIAEKRPLEKEKMVCQGVGLESASWAMSC